MLPLWGITAVTLARSNPRQVAAHEMKRARVKATAMTVILTQIITATTFFPVVRFWYLGCKLFSMGD